MYLFHDVVNEEVLLELLLQDQDLVLGLDAVVTVQPPDLEVLGEDARVKVHHHCVVLTQGLNLALEGTQILLYLQDFEIFLLSLILLLFLLDEVEEGDGGILLLIDTAYDLTVVDILILGDFRKGSTDFFILAFDLAVLDGVVMDREVAGEDEDFLLTEEADTEEVRLSDGVSFHEFKFLEIDIEEHELIIALHQEGYLSTIIQEAVIANMQRLDDEGKVLYFGLHEDRSRRLLIQLVFVAN
jgi:hypothetical protein